MKRTKSSPASKKETVGQEELRRFFLDRRSYPHRPKSVRLVETHASYVFAASPYVYKVKKPVNFGFLNFSTLPKRRYFCEREVSLNRRLSQDVHLGVVPIFVRHGSLTFEPEGEVVEYAVKMRQLDKRHLLSQLLRRNKVGRRELDRIIRVLKEFYQSQEPTADILKWGRIEKLKISTRENFRQSESFTGAMISAVAFEAIRFYTDCFYQRNLLLLERRVRERRIRDCHGDLRLDHVHLTPKRIAIYDCIEFNDRFRYIDVASDVAFLAMDLDYQGRRDLSRYFVRRMAKVLSDESMSKLIDFYKCYRAFVRGKVHSLRGADARADRNRARRYFQLALQYATCGSEPIVIIVMGRIASGKSELAKSLGKELGWNVFSSDRIRKELAGVPLYRRGDEAMRRQLYSETMARRTYKALASRAVLTAREKSGIILDATYGRRRHREQLRKELTKRRLDYCFIEARAPDAILKKRLGQRGVRSREISDARLEDFQALNRSYESPVELPADKIIVVSTAKAAGSALGAALKALARNRAQRPSVLLSSPSAI